jgi:hypothetical protein
MAVTEAARRLASLSQRERQVLGLVCSGLMYKDIAQNLFISLPTVKSVMGRVYVKLGLDQLDKGERMKAIYELYCPILKSSPLPQEPLPPDQNLPIPSAIIKMVDEDELLVIPPQAQTLAYNLPVKSAPAPTRGSRSFVLIGGLIGLLALSCLIIAILLSNQFIPHPNPTAVTFSGSPTTVAIIPTDTPVASTTPIPAIPTNTVFVSQNTPTASDTPQPTIPLPPTSTAPTINLPFSDNFSAGVNPAWQVQNGDWLTADGRFTISNAGNKWYFVVLDDPSWTNYRIKVNIKLEKSDEGRVAVIIRYLSSQNKYLVFNIENLFSKGGFATYSGSEFTYIAGYGSVRILHDFDLEIDAIGNNFVAKIDGMVTQQINLSGYEQGGVGLGINCFSNPCASIGNFQVSAP